MVFNIKYMCLAILLLGLISCGEEPATGTNEEITVRLTAGTDETGLTRADGASAADRCLLEVYTPDGTRYGNRRYTAKRGDDGQFHFRVRLASGYPYKFVFWADKSSEEGDLSDGVLFDTSAGLRNIKVKNNPESYSRTEHTDGFFATADADTRRPIPVEEKIVLRRPLCKLHITAANVPPDHSLQVKATVYTVFDAMSGTASGLESRYVGTSTRHGDGSGNPSTAEWEAFVLAQEQQGNISIEAELLPPNPGDPVQSYFTMDNLPLIRNYEVNITKNN